MENKSPAALFSHYFCYCYIAIVALIDFSALNMLDAVQGRLWEAWQSTDYNQIYTNGMQTVSDQIRREKKQRQEARKKAIEADLYRIKEQAPHVMNPAGRQFFGMSCKSCAPGSGVSFNPFLSRKKFLFCVVCSRDLRERIRRDVFATNKRRRVVSPQYSREGRL